MSNRGIVPPNFTSPTGQFRLLALDTVYTNAASGQGDYALFSDEEINGLIALYPNMLRAVGYGYLGLSARAAMESKDVKDYDLAADLTKRAADLRSTARAYFDRADEEAARTGEDSTFGVTEPHEEHGRNLLKPTEWDALSWGVF